MQHIIACPVISKFYGCMWIQFSAFLVMKEGFDLSHALQMEFDDLQRLSASRLDQFVACPIAVLHHVASFKALLDLRITFTILS
jgi:hypothetical protein